MTPLRRTVELSKWLSWALRHDPKAAGIELDGAGWTAIDRVLAAGSRHGQTMTRAELDHVVTSSDKQRFAISPDGRSIRANQGHSVQVDLDLAPQTPPARLFHGTVAGALEDIGRTGLQRRARHHVHLSAEPATATAVGARRGEPVVLVVDAARMHADGHVFYCSENGVWLVDAVPPAYLGRYESEPEHG